MYYLERCPHIRGVLIEGFHCIVKHTAYICYADTSGVVLYNKPYQLCVLPRFITSADTHYLQRLREEVSRLKFVEKNNDLYQFRQVRPSIYSSKAASVI